MTFKVNKSTNVETYLNNQKTDKANYSGDTETLFEFKNQCGDMVKFSGQNPQNNNDKFCQELAIHLLESSVDELSEEFGIDAEKFIELQKDPNKLYNKLKSPEFETLYNKYKELNDEILDKDAELKEKYPAVTLNQEEPQEPTPEQKADIETRRAEIYDLEIQKSVVYQDIINYLTDNI